MKFGMVKSTNQVQPKYEVAYTSLDILGEILGVAGLIFMAVYLGVHWGTLPNLVPTHFGFNGQVDAWGSKNTLLMLMVIGAIMYALLAVLARFPHSFNYPVAITIENATIQYRIARYALLLLRVLIVWMFAVINLSAVNLALDRSANLNSWMIVFTVAIVLVMAGLFYFSYKNK